MLGPRYLQFRLAGAWAGRQRMRVESVKFALWTLYSANSTVGPVKSLSGGASSGSSEKIIIITVVTEEKRAWKDTRLQPGGMWGCC